MNVFEGSPASEAGLQKGDAIVMIDGRPVSGFTLRQIDEIFKKQGEKHVLAIRRGDSAMQIKIKTRRWI